MRLSFLLALSCVLLTLAPAARAQAPAPVPFATVVGDPIPYRIDLPTEWEIDRGPAGARVKTLSTGSDELTVVLTAVDLVASGTERDPGVSEAEERRSTTERFLASDSLLYGLVLRTMRKEGEIRDLEREMTTLAGQRAAYVKGRIENAGTMSSFQIHLTVQHGILYVLLVKSYTEEAAAHEPLLARIRDSLVLAPAPAPR